MSNHALGTLMQLASRLPAGHGGDSRTAPLSATGKGGKKKGAQNKKAQQRCQQQVGTCDALLTAQCDGDQGCLTQRVPCCGLLSTCDFTAFLSCLS